MRLAYWCWPRSLAPWSCQVHAEFQRYAPAVGLRVGLAIGQSDFKQEQETLTGLSQGAAPPARGGHSNVDVLIATPGRLMDHLERTPGFTLEHLRYLVIDEVGTRHFSPSLR
jgi:ATP-dependent RNA helicase DDX51/DBP6